jgi:hypothetical protein
MLRYKREISSATSTSNSPRAAAVSIARYPALRGARWGVLREIAAVARNALSSARFVRFLLPNAEGTTGSKRSPSFSPSDGRKRPLLPRCSAPDGGCPKRIAPLENAVRRRGHKPLCTPRDPDALLDGVLLICAAICTCKLWNDNSRSPWRGRLNVGSEYVRASVSERLSSTSRINWESPCARKMRL